MRMNWRPVTIALLTTFIGAGEGVSAAAYYSSSGLVCMAEEGAYADDITLTTYGAINIDTSLSRNLMCPVAGYPVTGFDSEDVDIDGVRVYYRDQTTSGSVSAFIFARTTAGTYYATGYRYSCSTAGGCTSASNSHTGYGYLEWTGANLPNGGSNIADVGAYGAAVVLPPTPSAGLWSAVMSVVVQHQ